MIHWDDSDKRYLICLKIFLLLNKNKMLNHAQCLEKKNTNCRFRLRKFPLVLACVSKARSCDVRKRNAYIGNKTLEEVAI